MWSWVQSVMRRWWTNRWMRASAVAVLVAAWPACNSNVGPADGTASESVRGGSTGERVPARANLDFVLKSVDGRDVKLSDFKGKPLLINFWATWCGPCREEMPWFSQFAEKYRSRNFTVLGISVDDTAEEIRAYAAEQKVSYPMLIGREHDDLLKAYDAAEIVPVSWFVKPDGTVLVKVKGIHEKAWFERQIEALF